MPRWVNWRRVVLSSDPGSSTVSSLWLPGLAGWLACYCTNASGMLSSHQHSVLHINSHQWRKAVTCPMGCFLKLFSSALVPWSVLHLYCGVLCYKWVWTHGNRKSCAPKETNRENPSVSWARSQCALGNRTRIVCDTSSTEFFHQLGHFLYFLLRKYNPIANTVI